MYNLFIGCRHKFKLVMYVFIEIFVLLDFMIWKSNNKTLNASLFFYPKKKVSLFMASWPAQ